MSWQLIIGGSLMHFMFSTVCAALNVSANTCVSVNVFIMHQITSPSIHFLLLIQACVTGKQPKQRCPDRSLPRHRLQVFCGFLKPAERHDLSSVSRLSCDVSSQLDMPKITHLEGTLEARSLNHVIQFL